MKNSAGRMVPEVGEIISSLVLPTVQHLPMAVLGGWR